MKRIWFWVGLGLGIDQLTKIMAMVWLSVATPFVAVPGVLSLQLVFNYGAAYGILQHQRAILLAVSAIVIVGAIYWRKTIATTAWSEAGLIFLLIGTGSNFIDRLFRGYVIDFIDIGIFPVFNGSDVCIDIGIALFVLDIIRQYRATKQ